MKLQLVWINKKQSFRKIWLKIKLDLFQVFLSAQHDKHYSCATV